MWAADLPISPDDFRKWREQRMGWTQVQTAKALYLPEWVIAAYELGEIPVPPAITMAACWLAEELSR